MRKNISTYYIFRKIWKNLKTIRKIQSISVFLLMFICAITEIITVSSIVPFLESFSDSVNPNPTIGLSFISQNLIGMLGAKDNIFICGAPLLIFTILNSSLGLLNLYFSTKLVSLISHDFSYKAFKNHIRQPYLNQIAINTSELMSITSNNVNQFLYTLNFIFSLLVGLVISSFLIIFLISISFWVAIILFLISIIFYSLISFISRKWLYNNSKIAANHTKKHIKTVRESSGFLREILINQKEQDFINSYKKSDKVIRNFQARYEFLGGFSRYVLEALAIIFLVLISFIMNSSTQAEFNVSRALSVLAAYAFTVQRLLPAMQKVYYGISGIRARSEYLLDLFEFVEKNSFTKKIYNSSYLNKNFKFRKSIEFKKINFTFPSSNIQKRKKIFDSFSLEIKKGDHIGLIGPSGSGKSTLIDLLLGLIKPDEGKILVDGIDINSFQNKGFLYDWRNLVSFVPQEIYLGDYSLAENIAFTNDIEKINFSKLSKISEIVGISGFINLMPKRYLETVGDNGVLLSGGQKQRISIARALYREFDILILDESTNSLDKDSEQLLLKNLFKCYADKTIILITHKKDLLSSCNKVFDLGYF